MKIKTAMTKVLGFVVVASTLALGVSGTASAHVTVTPKEAVTSGYQTFTVNVPNEKAIPTVSVRVIIPNGVTNVTPTQKAGWQVGSEKTGEGEAAAVSSITWSGGAIEEGLRDEFSFSAKLPARNAALEWKAYQTYLDGTVVSWDKAIEGAHGTHEENTGPSSLTKVVSETEEAGAVRRANEAAANAQVLAERSLYLAAIGAVLGIVAIFIVTRKKS